MTHYSKNDSEYRNNGHYQINDIDFMSIWTFKNKHNIQPNTNASNGEDAQALMAKGGIFHTSSPDFGNQFAKIYIFTVTSLNNYFGISKGKNFNEITQNTNTNEYMLLYQKIAREIDKIKLLIMGQDPYPSGAIGVAFCKRSHDELYHENCSGGLVLTSLGYPEMTAKEKFKDPMEMFIHLLGNKGICFLNLNNRYFESPDQSNFDNYLLEKSIQETRNINIEFVKKSEKIILLGRGKVKQFFQSYYNEFKPYKILIHPSKKAKTSNEVEWLSTWTGNTLEKFTENYEDYARKPKENNILKHKLTNINSIVFSDEHHELEFKTSLLWSIDYTKEQILTDTSPEIKTHGKSASRFIIAKSIVAFLNSNGGKLIIGVKEHKDSQENEIVGIEHEFHKLKSNQNEDGYRLQLNELIDTYFPPNIRNHQNDYIQIEFKAVEKVKVCVITISKSNSHVFLNLKDNHKDKDKLIIRSDARTKKLSGNEMVDYIQKHFKAAP